MSKASKTLPPIDKVKKIFDKFAKRGFASWERQKQLLLGTSQDAFLRMAAGVRNDEVFKAILEVANSYGLTQLTTDFRALRQLEDLVTQNIKLKDKTKKNIDKLIDSISTNNPQSLKRLSEVIANTNNPEIFAYLLEKSKDRFGQDFADRAIREFVGITEHYPQSLGLDQFNVDKINPARTIKAIYGQRLREADKYRHSDGNWHRSFNKDNRYKFLQICQKEAATNLEDPKLARQVATAFEIEKSARIHAAIAQSSKKRSKEDQSYHDNNSKFRSFFMSTANDRYDQIAEINDFDKEIYRDNLLNAKNHQVFDRSINYLLNTRGARGAELVNEFIDDFLVKYQNNPNPSDKDNKILQRCLIVAAKTGSTELFEKIEEAGKVKGENNPLRIKMGKGETYFIDEDGKTMLHHVAKSGNDELEDKIYADMAKAYAVNPYLIKDNAKINSLCAADLKSPQAAADWDQRHGFDGTGPGSMSSYARYNAVAHKTDLQGGEFLLDALHFHSRKAVGVQMSKKLGSAYIEASAQLAIADHGYTGIDLKVLDFMTQGIGVTLELGAGALTVAGSIFTRKLVARYSNNDQTLSQMQSGGEVFNYRLQQVLNEFPKSLSEKDFTKEQIYKIGQIKLEMPEIRKTLEGNKQKLIDGLKEQQPGLSDEVAKKTVDKIIAKVASGVKLPKEINNMVRRFLLPDQQQIFDVQNKLLTTIEQAQQQKTNPANSSYNNKSAKSDFNHNPSSNHDLKLALEPNKQGEIDIASVRAIIEGDHFKSTSNKVIRALSEAAVNLGDMQTQIKLYNKLAEKAEPEQLELLIESLHGKNPETRIILTAGIIGKCIERVNNVQKGQENTPESLKDKQKLERVVLMAASMGNSELFFNTVQTLMKKYPDQTKLSDIYGQQGDTLMHYAAKGGNIEIIKSCELIFKSEIDKEQELATAKEIKSKSKFGTAIAFTIKTDVHGYAQLQKTDKRYKMRHHERLALMADGDPLSITNQNGQSARSLFNQETANNLTRLQGQNPNIDPSEAQAFVNTKYRQKIEVRAKAATTLGVKFAVAALVSAFATPLVAGLAKINMAIGFAIDLGISVGCEIATVIGTWMAFGQNAKTKDAKWASGEAKMTPEQQQKAFKNIKAVSDLFLEKAASYKKLKKEDLGTIMGEVIQDLKINSEIPKEVTDELHKTIDAFNQNNKNNNNATALGFLKGIALMGVKDPKSTRILEIATATDAKKLFELSKQKDTGKKLKLPRVNSTSSELPTNQRTPGIGKETQR